MVLGASDVIVVYSNEAFKSTPFFVHFGKKEVFRPKNKLVEIQINNIKINHLNMYLDEDGDAHFSMVSVKDKSKSFFGKVMKKMPYLTQSSESNNQIEKKATEEDYNLINSMYQKAKKITNFTISPFKFKLKQKKSGQILESQTKIDQPNSGAQTNNRYLKKQRSKSDYNLSVSALKNNIIQRSYSDSFIYSSSKESDESKKSMSETNLEMLQVKLINEKNTSFTNDSSLNLTSDQLKVLNLKSGPNEIIYSISSGSKFIIYVKAFIYFWSSDSRIITCDIDGTVTKSDIRGRLSHIFRYTWIHDGIAKLFTSLDQNSYKIVYLSARPYVEINKTRILLSNINQDGNTMPKGPVILSPSGLRNAFTSEIIYKRSHEFKIEVLENIKSIFDECYKPTDALTYRTVGIKESCIFITNSLGQINCDEQKDKSLSYKYLFECLGDYFPIKGE